MDNENFYGRKSMSEKLDRLEVKKIEELISMVRSDEEVLAVILFGSRARWEHHCSSDVDICLVLKPRSFSKKYLSYKKINYLKEFNLDIHVFQQLPIYIRKRVIKEGEILFCRDEDEMYNIAFKTMDEFSDFEYIYRDYLKEISDA